METLTLNQLTDLLKKADQRIKTKIDPAQRRIRASMLLLSSDLVMILLSLTVAIIFKNIVMSPPQDYTSYLLLVPLILVLLPVTYLFRGLYPGFGIDEIDELRTLTISTSIVFGVLSLFSLIYKGHPDFSRLIFFASWFVSLFAIPIGRFTIRRYFSRKRWWGVPVVIIGGGNSGEAVINSLQKHKHVGLIPSVCIEEDPDKWGYISGVPVIGGYDTIPRLVEKLNYDHVIIAISHSDRNEFTSIYKRFSKHFKNITIIPDMEGIKTLWVSSHNISGIVSFEINKGLEESSNRFKKRALELLVCSVLSVVALPLILIIAILIKLDSKGPVFFRQKRRDISGNNFHILKFRTMYPGAEQRLKAMLDKNEDLRWEFQHFHKLKSDPRMTRIGKIIRKYSLDELPQFFHVLSGKMSLIGPRAIMDWEIHKYDIVDYSFDSIKSGITGLWQVTLHNEQLINERLISDLYYIRNWSLFLDIYIIFRTIIVMLSGRGC